jgi:outer membrane protein assembly factor BamA
MARAAPRGSLPLGPAHVTRPLAAALLALSAAGCLHSPYVVPPCSRPDFTGCVIESVSVTGNHEVPEGAVTDGIATHTSDHPLAGAVERVPILSLWDRLSVDYEKLDPFVLEKDLARVERIYRARGYYEAHARAARVRADKRGRVHVEIVVDEGKPVLVALAQIAWKKGDVGATLASITGAGLVAEGAAPAAVAAAGATSVALEPTFPDKTMAAIQQAVGAVKVGEPLVEATFEDAKGVLKRALTDRGFAFAKVEVKADVDVVNQSAVVTFLVDTGPPTRFGPVTLEGQGDLPEDRLRTILSTDVKEGDIYSTARLDKAQASLSDLRVFGSVDAVPQLDKPGEPDAKGQVPVPIKFHFTRTTLKTVKSGFGVEAGTRVDAHALVGWENRNFFGGLRSFTIEGRPGIVFFPYTLTSLFSGSSEAGFAVVPELRIHTVLAQPGFVEGLTRGLVAADINVYQLQPTATLGYLEGSIKTGVERDFWVKRVHVNLIPNVQFDQPLQLTLPGLKLEPCAGGYSFLVIPYVQTVGTIDFRLGEDGKRNSVDPHSGFYFSNDLQVAAGPSNHSSTDIRVRPDFRAYLPVAKKLTLAFRLGGGFLHPFGGDLSKTPYSVVPAPNTPPDNLKAVPGALPYSPAPLTPGSAGLLAYTNPNATTCTNDTNTANAQPNGVLRGSYVQLLQLRGFQSGGTTSNRGYVYSGIGAQEQVIGISPLDPTGVPIPIATGGLAMWEASVELRFPLFGGLGATLFLDGSDVRDHFADFAAPFAPHLSTGLGIRYKTPVGPLRADVGLRIPNAQVIGTTCRAFDPSATPSSAQIWTGGAQPAGVCYIDPRFGQAGSLGGVPIALSLAIGEAF